MTYNAQNHIESVLEDIECKEDCEILISDDASTDKTLEVILNYQKNHPNRNIKLIAQKKNLGYGGNQKFGFNYAIKNGFYALILIHGDGQYSPKLIPQIVRPIFENKASAVLGSRMINKKNALKGGMPLYKFIGNIILTKAQNLLLGSNLAEFHTGLRAYKIDDLARLPFNHNDNGFSFDTDILIQLIDNKMMISEVAIPTKYGDEICHVVGVVYAAEIMAATLISRLQKIGLVRLEKFNYNK